MALPTRTYWADQSARRGLRQTVLRCESLEPRRMLAGTAELVKDILPGAKSSLLSHPVMLGDAAYFLADDGVHGEEIWRTDGTSGGTRLLKDIGPGSRGSGIGWYAPLTAADGRLQFLARPFGDPELWVSDGTELGTQRQIELKPYTTDGYVGGLWIAGGVTYFTIVNGNFPDYDHLLWRTDGTPSGTWLVKDLGPNLGMWAPGPIARIGDKLIFVASTDSYPELGSVDPTGAVTRIGQISISTGAVPSSDGLYLFEYAPGFRTTLSRTDGSANSKTLVADLSVGGESPDFSGAAAQGDGVVFGTTENRQATVWSATATGAAEILTIDGGAFRPYLRAAYFQSIGHITVFEVADKYEPERGRALWRTDGTPEGTARFYDFDSSTQPYFDDGVTQDGILYFPVSVAGKWKLWRTDGSAEGTTLVTDIEGTWNDYFALDVLPLTLGKLLLFPNDGVHGSEPWLWQPLAGDANLDDQVDLNDFGVLKAALGKTGQGQPADFDFDGQVDLDDFAILKGQFGSRIPAAPVSPSPAQDRSLAAIGVAFARGAGDWWRPNDDREATLEPLSRLSDARNIPPTASPRVAR